MFSFPFPPSKFHIENCWLLAFTVVNLLNFYVNQFGALSAFFSNLLVYFILVAYRSWYLAPRDGSE